MIKIPSNKILKAAAAGGVSMFLLIFAARFVLTESPTHYHANFEVYINGEKEAFDSELYYEEVQSCSAATIGPKTRTHMHKPDTDVIHVHDEGVTWGHFFANLGWNLGNDFIKTDTDLFTDNKDDKMIFILNGQQTKNVYNKVINTEDSLLISYGDTLANSQKLASNINQSASRFNEEPDPAACSGSDEESLNGRVKRSLPWN